MYDAIVIGGGPAGLQAALTFARGQRRAIVVDDGPPRNSRATELHNFLTRDGTPPRSFRELAHRELATYGVEVRSSRVLRVAGGPDAFEVHLTEGSLAARRIVVCTGMIDMVPDRPGFRELWGGTVFQCPFCHGHEHRGRRFATWITDPAMAAHASMLLAWTDDLIVLTDGAELGPLDLPVETARVRALRPRADDPERLGAIELEDGRCIERDVLQYRPPQAQTELVLGLGLQLDSTGFVVVDAQCCTSRPGIYAAGDLTTPFQAALAAAAAGLTAAAMVCHSLGARLG
jgi:thioredoxin reductase